MHVSYVAKVTRLRLSDGAQLVARGPHVRINYAKFEQSSLPPRVRINLPVKRIAWFLCGVDYNHVVAHGGM